MSGQNTYELQRNRSGHAQIYVPKHVQQQLADVDDIEFSCELTEEGILYRPVIARPKPVQPRPQWVKDLERAGEPEAESETEPEQPPVASGPRPRASTQEALREQMYGRRGESPPVNRLALVPNPARSVKHPGATTRTPIVQTSAPRSWKPEGRYTEEDTDFVISFLTDYGPTAQVALVKEYASFFDCDTIGVAGGKMSAILLALMQQRKIHFTGHTEGRSRVFALGAFRTQIGRDTDAG